MFDYKGYSGKINTADSETGWFTGSVIGIQDVVTFEGKTARDLAKAFHDSVDDYLEFCGELKESAEKPFSGKFVLRLSPDLHRRASEAADGADVSLNSWIVAAVKQRLSGEMVDSASMPVDEMKHLAQCVAAILAEKKARPENGAKNTSQRGKPMRKKAAELS
jgi:predicted HicB family RNase H-like nuclease